MHAKPYLIFVFLFPCSSMATQTLNDLGENQSIYIKREGQNKTALRMLKSQREMCITEKDTLIQGRTENPRIWPIVLAALKRDRPGYNVDAPLTKEPDWQKMLVEIEEEYFQGDRYAKYITTSDHKLIDDGTCRFEEKQHHSAEIDTGKFRYDLRLDEKYGEKFPSPVVIDRQYNADMRAMMQQNPAMQELMQKTGTDMGMSQAGEKLGELTKVSGQDQVAGETCEYVGPVLPTRLCYWKTMHEYPTIMRRALILKSVVSIGKDNNISEAVKFTRSTGFDPKIFSVPNGFKIESQM